MKKIIIVKILLFFFVFKINSSNYSMVFHKNTLFESFKDFIFKSNLLTEEKIKKFELETENFNEIIKNENIKTTEKNLSVAGLSEQENCIENMNILNTRVFKNNENSKNSLIFYKALIIENDKNFSFSDKEEEIKIKRSAKKYLNLFKKTVENKSISNEFKFILALFGAGIFLGIKKNAILENLKKNAKKGMNFFASLKIKK